MQLYGTGAYMNGQIPAGVMLGLSPASQSKAAGESTPPVTAAGGDHQAVPWSLDSPQLWLAIIAGLTVLGMAGADVKVRLFKGRAGANVGQA